MRILPSPRRALSAAAFLFPLLPLPAQSPPSHDLHIVADQATAALEILDARRLGRGNPITGAAWSRLFESEGYRRLRAREASIGVPFSDSAFRAFLLDDSLAVRGPSLRDAMAFWRTMRPDSLVAAAGRYLPDGTVIRARIYPLIKPRRNSFVHRPTGEVPAIMVYVDPARTAAQTANTLVHEIHHIGVGIACSDTPVADASPAVKEARRWLSALSEGLAMLAAAGDVGTHPHANSPPEDRARWDAEMAAMPRQFEQVESLVQDILAGRLTETARQERGMALFGVQGPWYVAGYQMARTVELRRGRVRLVTLMCDPVALMREYNEVAEPGAPRWSDSMLASL